MIVISDCIWIRGLYEMIDKSSQTAVRHVYYSFKTSHLSKMLLSFILIIILYYGIFLV